MVARVQRRSFDARTGFVKRPVTVFEAFEHNKDTQIKFRCPACLNSWTVNINRFDPEMPVPDVGIGKVCDKCGHDDIESWGQHESLLTKPGVPVHIAYIVISPPERCQLPHVISGKTVFGLLEEARSWRDTNDPKAVVCMIQW